jgi:hypothetical protein
VSLAKIRDDDYDKPSALIKFLVKKGIITEEELLEEIKKIKNKRCSFRVKGQLFIVHWVSGFLPHFYSKCPQVRQSNGFVNRKGVKRRVIKR